MCRIIALVLFFAVGASAADWMDKLRDLAHPAILVKDTHPVYPEEAIRAGIEGEVVVVYEFGPDGKVTTVKTSESAHPLLREAVAAAMKQREYRPYDAKINKPGKVFVRLCYEFRLPRHSNESPTVRLVRLPEDRWRHEMPAAVYPFEMLQAGKNGKAEATFWLGRDGRPDEIEITEATSKEFGYALQAQVATMRTLPPRDGRGRYVRTQMFWRQTFTVDGGADVPVGEVTRELASGSPAGGSGILAENIVAHPPVALSTVDPIYPVNLRRKRPKGEATISWVVDKEGNPQAIRIIEATRVEFGYAAAQAVSQWKFTPGQHADEAVPVLMQKHFTFAIQTEK